MNDLIAFVIRLIPIVAVLLVALAGATFLASLGSLLVPAAVIAGIVAIAWLYQSVRR